MRKYGAGFHRKLEALLLLASGLMIFKLYVSGNLSHILADRMLPFSIIALVLFSVISVCLFQSGKTHVSSCDCCGCETSNKKQVIYPYLLFGIPLFLGFIMTDFSLSEQALANKGLQNGTFSTKKMEEGSYDLEKDAIQVTDENYFEVFNHLYTFLDDMEGKQISLAGFVYREPDFPNNQIAIARLTMTCCIADANVYGFIFRGDVEKLKTNQWYEVQGKIGKETYKGEVIPVIRLNTFNQIQPPKEQYLSEYTSIE